MTYEDLTRETPDWRTWPTPCIGFGERKGRCANTATAKVGGKTCFCDECESMRLALIRRRAEELTAKIGLSAPPIGKGRGK
jgi:hypothetical protein